MKTPIVSILISTKNEENHIEECLMSISQQTYPQDKIEIVVVDNNSSDNTKKIAKKYTNKVYNFGPERSAQRNFAAKKSKGEYYLYLDADMVLHTNLIKECVEKINKNQDVVALYIPEIISGEKFWCKVRRFERSFYNETAIDSIRFIRKQSFWKVGGFDIKICAGPEDWDLDKRMREIGKVTITKSPIYHNEKDFNIRGYINKKKYYMRSFDAYINKWGIHDVDIQKQFGFYYRYIEVFIEKGKWKLLIRHPVLTSGMIFLRSLVGINFLVIRYNNWKYQRRKLIK